MRIFTGKQVSEHSEAVISILLHTSVYCSLNHALVPAWLVKRAWCSPFQAEAPGNDVDIFRQAHGPQHLWAEHAAVAHLDGLAQVLAPGKDLHAGLCVGVEGRLELEVLQAQPAEEGVQDAYQIPQRQAPITHHACIPAGLPLLGGSAERH